MKSENLEVVKGSGNVFRDLGHKNADADQFKAILAAETVDRLMSIINRLGSRVEVKIKVRRAETVEHGMPA